MSTSTKLATKAQRASAIGEAAEGRGLTVEQLKAIQAGEVIVVPGMGAGVALTIARIEQRAAKALQGQGRKLDPLPNVQAVADKVHEAKAPKGRAGIGGRADEQAMAEFIAEWLSDDDNMGVRGWSASKASRAYQAANKGKGSWPVFRELFGAAVAQLDSDDADPRAALIEQAKGQAMRAGVGYGGRDWADRFATWCKANNPEAAKALQAIQVEREQAAKAAKARAAEAAKAKAAKAAAAKRAATKAAKATSSTTTKAKAPRTTKAASSTTKAPRAKAATK